MIVLDQFATQTRYNNAVDMARLDRLTPSCFFQLRFSFLSSQSIISSWLIQRGCVIKTPVTSLCGLPRIGKHDLSIDQATFARWHSAKADQSYSISTVLTAYRSSFVRAHPLRVHDCTSFHILSQYNLFLRTEKWERILKASWRQSGFFAKCAYWLSSWCSTPRAFWDLRKARLCQR